MTKMVEILFRNKLRLATLLLLPVLVSGVIVFFLPRSYQSSARLLALKRYEMLGATGPESDLQSTPAVTQAIALTGFLQTQNFDLKVANDTDLAKQMDIPASDTQRLNDGLYTEISTHVTVIATGVNLFEISYTNKDPVVAMQVVQAVVAHFGEESVTQATEEGKQLLNSYQGRLDAAQAEANSTTRAAAQYLKDHNLTPTTAQYDPQYTLLASQADQARTALENIQADVDKINSQLAQFSLGPQALYRVMDAPTVPTKPESRTKSLMLGGGVGLAIGLLAFISYFLILVRLDQSVYSPADMPTVTEYPVLIQIPRLPRRSATWITRSNGKLASGKGA